VLATPPPSDTAGTGDPEGVIAGALLREIRRRLGLRQDAMAEVLRVDINTYRSWENGRRPLARIPVHRLRALVQGLLRIGADAEIVELLDTAIDVDLNIGQILANHRDPADHPLANWVQTRSWHDLLAWGLAGRTPRALSGAGEVARPRLARVDREAVLGQLRDAAEQTRSNTDATSTLLRRQVYFVASWDATTAGRDWLSGMEAREYGRMRLVDGWTPTWVASRSLAVAKAVSGDPGHLRYFISHQLRGDDQEVANLNYWANWSGEDNRPALTDEFMKTSDLGPWRGTELLRQLAAGMNPPAAYVDLTVHTVWALLRRRPWLLDDDLALTTALRANVEHLLDHPEPLSDQARRELAEINYATNMRRSA
jgi:transcriptional regulator with XRE-family HTH domain